MTVITQYLGYIVQIGAVIVLVEYSICLCLWEVVSSIPVRAIPKTSKMCASLKTLHLEGEARPGLSAVWSSAI